MYNKCATKEGRGKELFKSLFFVVRLLSVPSLAMIVLEL
jgi:hypothetical protein